MWTSGKIAEHLKGQLYGDAAVPFKGGCALDSRQVKPGEIFVALKGEKTDGHLFLSNALATGATIAIAEKSGLAGYGLPPIPEGKAVIEVENSREALQSLAKAWRGEINPKVIGITGSTGKTTTKDMVAAVLAQKYRVYKNKENHNNEIGLPLTILEAAEDTEVLVLEMGMRGLGQIDALCQICSPTVGVITNIGTTHLELLGTQERIAQAKWELIANLPAEGIAVLNAEDYHSVKLAANSKRQIIFYGLEGRYAEPHVQGMSLKPSGSLHTFFQAKAQGESCEVRLPLPGEHNVLDALAALAVGLVCGVSLKQGSQALADFELSSMRLEVIPGINGSTILSDVYNANPASMQASLKILAERGGAKTIAILGEMYELGEAAVSGHREVGQAVARLGINKLVTVGPLAEEIAQGALTGGLALEQIHTCADCRQAAALTEQILKETGAGAWILIKGSRGMRMERITELLRRKE
ncbi:MAG TPA: UDP-N-acetylmuramoyl-tripeptide--D-alanyl-D-alanine ligase [Peptococcaceae bacterium]|nr:UDP-N-acetylmuramoyl-tripeptide--D-alanyl-D-alanine ligase [Peptococcaceae bacterium]